ncbi:hypothetical protein PC129_g18611 [Phytophthora cactorum]|uniref:PiggyBac transposable element-derived protein domain-containing protein n=1 Tax=Phytophthora cactorum TaxID=29920 RepID=A0A8T1F3N6_9STRA|nr:hypothetical protein Pcac1_g22638 [Phytophthora cactorum]KAG2794509.1 hypothetical protein PC111_g22566 [Phytophthora cactorum]KAG2800406.1 hypothetical protein PC112_g20496 [Phytophthora cactorum]KAG2834449.1 hypothetical protein PC113_g20396 [Phytophthora cactorum]KAG2879542.1 hypothetical protein PC114_g22528 [Phytophthora cactorum]
MDGDENGVCSDNQGPRRLVRQARESGACVVAQIPTVTHDAAVINELAANNASNVASQHSVAPCQSTANNEGATDNQQTVANQETTALQGAVSSQVSVGSQMAIASKNAVACQATATNLEGAVATLPRKRGRPKGSKNKRKQDQTAVDKPTSKRARKPANGSRHRRSLDTAMIGERVQLAPTDSTESTAVATTHPGTVSNQPAAIECQGPATPTLAHTSVPLQPQLADSSAVGVGNAFIISRVCRVVKALYQVRWVDSQFQSNVENLTLSMVQRRNTNYSAPHGHATGPGWGRLCAVDLGERVEIDEPAEELEVCMEPYKPPTELPTTDADVEVIKNFRFDPLAALDKPGHLYHHGDATTTTRLPPEFRHIFEHSASSSFFAYIPVAFWQQVVREMNMYSRLNDIAIGTPFTLQEIMTFLSILFYTALVKKG